MTRIAIVQALCAAGFFLPARIRAQNGNLVTVTQTRSTGSCPALATMWITSTMVVSSMTSAPLSSSSYVLAVSLTSSSSAVSGAGSSPDQSGGPSATASGSSFSVTSSGLSVLSGSSAQFGASAGISGTSPSMAASSVTSSAPSAITSNPIDDQVNAGAPFIIQLPPPIVPIIKRADPQISYLMSNGNTTTDRAFAAIFQLTDDGQLTADSLVESTDHIIDFQAFAGSPSDSVEPITRTFKAVNGAVVWTNETFEGNVSSFYRTPRGQADNAMIIARFRGPVNPEWERIPLAVARKLFSALIV